MLCFRQMRSLQKFAAVHSSVDNHFNLDRHLNTRPVQGEPARRAGRVATTRRLIRAALPRTETGSLKSNSTFDRPVTA